MRSTFFAGAMLLCLAVSAAPQAHATNFAILLTGADGVATEVLDTQSVDVEDLVFDYDQVDVATPDMPNTVLADAAQGFTLFRPGNHKPGKMSVRREFAGKDMTYRNWR